jgi:hypothetical protein
MTGQPAVTVPAGFTKDGLPIGLQIVGRQLDDATVLWAAAAYEAAAPWKDKWPPMLAQMGYSRTASGRGAGVPAPHPAPNYRDRIQMLRASCALS